MLSIYTSGGRKRRLWSPATVALSVAAHVLLLGGGIYAAGSEPPAQRAHPEPEPYWIDTEPPPPAQARVDEPPPPPDEPQAPQETAGDFVQPVPPDEPPVGLPEVDLDASPLTQEMVTGLGVPGEVYDPSRVRRGEEAAPAGSGGAAEVFELGGVDERPALRNGREMERLLKRLYPPLLQEAGITGRTELRFVVDAEGNVEPGSITVVSSTNAGFAEASTKVAEKFSFRPARVRGRPVRVTIQMPIQWTLEGR